MARRTLIVGLALTVHVATAVEQGELVPWRGNDMPAQKAWRLLAALQESH